MHVILLSLFLSLSVQAEDGRVSVFTFFNGQPMTEVRAKVGDREFSSSTSGLVRMELSEGPQNIQIWTGQKELLAQFQLNVIANREIEVMVTLSSTGPQIDIEGGQLTKDATHSPIGEKTLFNGQVTSLDGGHPIAGARIFVKGQSIDVVTDEMGHFQVEVPIGSQVVSVVHKDFSVVTEQVQLEKDKSLEKMFKLAPAAIDLGEFVVLAPHVGGSIAALIEERKKAASVKDVIGREQMSKSGDGSAASALRRVTGLSLVGGKFVYVRGLGERYSSTLINGAQIPSPDPNRRVVPMDMIPSDVIESMAIQKSYTPDSPAEFGGGTIQVRTLKRTDENYFKIGLSTKQRPGQTGQQGLSYAHHDRFGFSSRQRQMPGKLRTATEDNRELRENIPGVYDSGFSKDELYDIGQSVNMNFDLKQIDLPAGFGQSVSGARNFGSGSRKFGVLFGLDYGNDWSHKEYERYSYNMDSQGLVPGDSYIYTETEEDIGLSGLISAHGEFEDMADIQLMSMVSRNTSNETRVRIGQDTNVDRQDNRRRFRERQLRVNQLLVNHPIGQNSKVHWQVTLADAANDEPDLKEDAFVDDDGQLVISPEGVDNTVSWSTLRDNTQDFRMGIDLRVLETKWLEANVLSGVGIVARNREFSLRRFGFHKEDKVKSPQTTSADEAYASGSYILKEKTLATDNYEAEQEIESGYLATQGVLFDRLQFLAGSRYEKSVQNVVTFDLFDSSKSVNSDLTTIDVLPVTNISWILSETAKIRLGYSQTIARPDFKELSTAAFKDDRYDRLVVGNNKLLATVIDNVDARFEWYPRSNESFSIGVFQKKFENPIEIAVGAGSKGTVTFVNAESAINSGLEFEFRNQLSRDFSVTGNMSWIDSQIKLNPTQRKALTSIDRQLQGQSPYIYNFHLHYNNEANRLNLSLLYNVFGPRIFLVGTNRAPDIFEQTFEEFDIVLSKKFLETSSIKFKLKNVFDPIYTFTQGDEITQKGRKGRSASLSYSATF